MTTRTSSQGDLQSKSLNTATQLSQKTQNQLPFQSHSTVNTDLQRLYNNWKLDPGFKHKLEESEIRHGLHNWGLWRTKMNEILIMSIMNSNSKESSEDGYEKIRSIRFHKEQFKLDPKTARFIYYYGSNQDVKPILDPDAYMFRGIPRAQTKDHHHQSSVNHSTSGNAVNSKNEHEIDHAPSIVINENAEKKDEKEEKQFETPVMTNNETIKRTTTNLVTASSDMNATTHMSTHSEQIGHTKKKQVEKLFSGNNVRDKVKAFEIVSESSGYNSNIQRQKFIDELVAREEEIEKIKQKFEDIETNKKINNNKTLLHQVPPPPPPPPPLPPNLPPPPLPALPGHLSIENSKKNDVDLKHDINVNSLLTETSNRNATKRFEQYEKHRSHEQKGNTKLNLNKKFNKEKNIKVEILKAVEGDIIFGNGSEHQRSMPSIGNRSNNNMDDFSEKIEDDDDKRPISTDNISGVQLGTESPLLMPDEEAKAKKGKNGKKDNLKFKLIKHDGYSYLLPFKNILKSKKRSVDINDSQNFTSATNTPVPDDITKSEQDAKKKTSKQYKFLSGFNKGPKKISTAPSATKASKPLDVKYRMQTPKIGSKKIRAHRRPSIVTKPKLIKNKKASQRVKNHGSVKHKVSNQVNRNNLCSLPGIETESVHSKVSKFLNESNDLTFSQIDDKDIIDLTSDTEELKTIKTNNEIHHQLKHQQQATENDSKCNKLSDVIKLARNLDPPKIPPPIPPPPNLPARIRDNVPLRDSSATLTVPPPPRPPPLTGIEKSKIKSSDFETKIMPRRRPPTPPSISTDTLSSQHKKIQHQKPRGLSNDALANNTTSNKNKTSKNSVSVDPIVRNSLKSSNEIILKQQMKSATSNAKLNQKISSKNEQARTVSEININFVAIKSDEKTKKLTVSNRCNDEILVPKNNFKKNKDPNGKRTATMATTIKQVEKKNFYKSIEIYRKDTHQKKNSEESDLEDFEEERRKARLNRRKKDKTPIVDTSTVTPSIVQDITSSVSYDCKCHSIRHDHYEDDKCSESKLSKAMKPTKLNKQIIKNNESFSITKTMTKTKLVPGPQTPSFDCVTTYIESDAVEEAKVYNRPEKSRLITETKTLLGSNTTFLATSTINGFTTTTTNTNDEMVRSNVKSNQIYELSQSHNHHHHHHHIHHNNSNELNSSKLIDVHTSEHEMNTSKTKPKTSKQILQEIAMLTNGTTPRRKLVVTEIESQSTLNSNSKSAAFSN